MIKGNNKRSFIGYELSMLINIKKLQKWQLTALGIAAAVCFMSTDTLCAKASPRLMSDGNYFDAAFYADNNPDVVSSLGLKVQFGEPIDNAPETKPQNTSEEEISPEQVRADVEATISVQYDNAASTSDASNLLRETTMDAGTEELLYSHYLQFGRGEKRLAYFIDKSVPYYAGTTLSPKDSKPYEYIIIMGDSRTCAMAHCFYRQNDWKLVKVYTLKNPLKMSSGRKCSVFEKNGIRMAFCEFGGGNLVNGAFNQVCNWAKQIIATAEPGSHFQIINNMGVNDIFYEPNEGAAMSYRMKNEEFAASLPAGSRFITCTVGPVDDRGTVAQSGLVNNSIIAIQNSMVVPTEHVQVFDEYTALTAAGYKCMMTKTDPAGIHYEDATSVKLIKMFLEACGFDPKLFTLAV